MNLKFNKEEVTEQLETIELQKQDSVVMIEMFVKYKLSEAAQMVFYSHLKDQEITITNIEKALHQAVLTQMSTVILKYALNDYDKNPGIYEDAIKDHLDKLNK